MRTTSSKLFDLVSVAVVAAAVPLAPVPSILKVPAALLIILVVLMLSGRRWSDLGLRRPHKTGRAVALGVAAGFLLQAVALLIVLPVLRALGVAMPDLAPFQIIEGNPPILLVYLVVAWTSAAFGEELIWRGFLLHRIAGLLGNRRSAWWIGVVSTSILFGLAHAYQGTTGVILTGLTGLAFGGLFLLTGRNLWPIIVAHGTMDTISFLLIYAGATDWLA